ncbi:MAG TPA: GrpB family protein [Roseiflexaceae bacterium]|nr:GrpB family protein [Roseiflexaceae bacterium]
MVIITPYDPRWPLEFAAIGIALRTALGDHALRIDHIGSTSVPGLAAKDRIDVQIAVASFDRFDDIRSRVEGLGYQTRPFVADHEPPGWQGPPGQWEKRYFTSPPGMRPTNIHVRILENANQRYAVLFRDYLRAHPKSAAAYGELKRRLADNLRDIDLYPDVKDPACDLIAVAAEDWAEVTGWRMGPSDA